MSGPVILGTALGVLALLLALASVTCLFPALSVGAEGDEGGGESSAALERQRGLSGRPRLNAWVPPERHVVHTPLAGEEPWA